MMTTREQIMALSELWRESVSDPEPPEQTILSWLTRYGYVVMQHAIRATIRRHNRASLDYEGALRYCASCARNKHEENTTFKPPAEWLSNNA